MKFKLFIPLLIFLISTIILSAVLFILTEPPPPILLGGLVVLLIGASFSYYSGVKAALEEKDYDRCSVKPAQARGLHAAQTRLSGGAAFAGNRRIPGI